MGKPGHVWVQTVVVLAEGPSSAREGDRGVEGGVKEDCAWPGRPGGGAQGPCLVLLVEREQRGPGLSLHLMEVMTASTLQRRMGVHVGYLPPQAGSPWGKAGRDGERGAVAMPQGSCAVSSWWSLVLDGGRGGRSQPLEVVTWGRGTEGYSGE